MTKSYVNLVKLCVGAENVSDLVTRQTQKKTTISNTNDRPKIIHVTRMWPKREKELTSGGSIYWVFKGLILARQEIEGLQEIKGADGIKRCGLILSRKIFRTEPKPKRAFQGWRYLQKSDSPKDLGRYSLEENELPRNMQLELTKLGIL